MNLDWVASILANGDLCRMGHAQRAQDQNLGLGWLYYALGRTVRPKQVVCIGSWRGFVPIVFGQALRDNGEGGRVIFIDPSLVDDFWADPQRTAQWFGSFGLDNVEHHRRTTQQFVDTDAYRSLGEVGLLFVDGFHSAEQARFDHEAFADMLADDAFVLFHDSVRPKSSKIYGEARRYTHTVYEYMNELRRRPGLEVMDFPMDSGVTLVRRASGEPGAQAASASPSSRR